MRIEYNEPGRIEYYREVVNTAIKLKKIRNDHQMKIRDFGVSSIIWLVFMVAALIYGVACAIYFQMAMYIVLCVLAVFGIGLSIFDIVRIKKMSSNYIKNFKPSAFTMDEEGLTLEREDEETHTMTWDEIYFVMINHYSITFIPVDGKKMTISVPVEHKDELLAELKSLDKSSLVADNTSNYVK